MPSSGPKTLSSFSKNTVINLWKRHSFGCKNAYFGDTTVEELERLASDIERYNNLDYTFWTWRLYKPVENCDFIVPARENTIEMMKEVSKNHPKIWLGIRAKWEKGGMLYFKEERIINQTPDVTQEDVSEIGSGNKIIL